MTGLNDNFLLADDSMESKEAPAATVAAFKDTAEGSEVPELRDDVDLIAVATEDLEVQLRDLSLLQESIKTHGGMCQTIALEAQALLPDFISDERPIGFFTKHPSKTMLSTALEEINDEKKNIVQRMVEAIVNFIKRVVERLKAFFSKFTKDKAKEDEEFVKNYKGPDESHLVKEIDEFLQMVAKDPDPEKLPRAMERFNHPDHPFHEAYIAWVKSADIKATKPATETIAIEDANIGRLASASLEEALSSFKRVTGKPLTKEKMISAYQAEQLKRICLLLGEDRIVLVGSMLEASFSDAYSKATNCIDKIVLSPFRSDNLDNYLKFSTQATEFMMQCQEVIGNMRTESEEVRTKKLASWIIRGDTDVVQRMRVYWNSIAMFDHITPFMEKLEEYVENLKSDSSPETVEKLKVAQKTLSNFTAYFSLTSRIAGTNEILIKSMRRS